MFCFLLKLSYSVELCNFVAGTPKTTAFQHVSHVFSLECCGTVEAFLKRDGPSCTFKQAYPDGDVHWFHDSRNISNGSVMQHTVKSIDTHGWMIIHSWLTFPGTLERSSHKPYNCSLKSSFSGRYIASTVVLKNNLMASRDITRYGTSAGNRARSQQAVKTALPILVSLIATLIL